MSEPLTLAVMGAGLIGRQHIAIIMSEPTVRLTAIVDPDPGARDLAERHAVRWFPDLPAMLEATRPDGVIVATPNQLHVEHGLACVSAGIPVLVEKPIADSVDAARALVEAAERYGVPLLVGHHRRHNPLITAAREAIAAGAIGRVVAVHATCWFFKPDEYFEPAWRRSPGAGPVLVNLIHDVDLLRHLCGEIVAVQAIESNAVRGNPVEETAAIVLHFESGALGTVTVSDTVVAPWSWELTSRENAIYQPSGEECYLIGGTHGSLTVPSVALWRNSADRSWHRPVERSVIAHDMADPLAVQIRHFGEVIRGDAAPLVSGREGLATLEVIAAIKRAAKSGSTERVRQG
jgi:predicted dehydrogenase